MAHRYIKKSPKALTDLEDISSYLLLHASLRTAERFLEAAEQTFMKLATMPGMGSQFETQLLKLTGIRTMSIKGFKRYMIMYREIPKGIEVLRVIHGSRNWQEELD